MHLEDLVEPRLPRVELVEEQAGVLGPEDGLARHVDQGIAGRGAESSELRAKEFQSPRYGCNDSKYRRQTTHSLVLKFFSFQL